MRKSDRTPEEDEYVDLMAGDGLVAIVESCWEIGAEILGLEPEKGYTIYKTDYKGGLGGGLWKALEKLWGIMAGYYDKKGDENPDVYQSSFWAPRVEGIRRWIWEHECFPAYKRVSLDREEAYATRLVTLERQRGEAVRIFFFVGAGHKWNTLKEIDNRRTSKKGTHSSIRGQ